MLIADIRTRLHQLAETLRCPELHDLAEATRRKPRATQAPVRSTPMTADLRRRIWLLHFERPELSQHDIAQLLGTNQGRVSETLAGKRQ